MKLGKRWVARIAPSDDFSSWVPVVNEIPQGSRSKYRLDKVTGQLTLARALPAHVSFPANYGFIPHTRSPADDEETDVLVFSGEPLFPLTIVHARIIGGFVERTSDQSEPESRLVAVVADDPAVERIYELEDLDGDSRGKIEAFVQTYKQNQGVEVSFAGWFDRAAALAQLERDFRRGRKRAAR
jgi:inorganic pyrophosphatase